MYAVRIYVRTYARICYDTKTASVHLGRPFLYMCMFVWQSSLYIRASQVFLSPCTSLVSAPGEAMEAAILARAAVVREDFEYLGFAEWIAWGWHHKVRIMILLGESVHGGSEQLRFRERERERDRYVRR